MKEWFKKYKHGWILLYFVFYLVWFGFLEKKVTAQFNVVHMAIDDFIPFCEYFIIPYLLWFLYIAVAVVYFMFTNTSDFYKLCWFLFAGMTIFLIVSTVYPNGHCLRPSVFENDNVFTRMVEMLYATDTSTNLFPSIHVYNSLGVHIAVAKSEKLQQYKWVQAGSFVLMFSIVLATVFLKQHSVFDVIWACALATVVYALVYRKGFAQNRKRRLRTRVSEDLA